MISLKLLHAHRAPFFKEEPLVDAVLVVVVLAGEDLYHVVAVDAFEADDALLGAGGGVAYYLALVEGVLPQVR